MPVTIESRIRRMQVFNLEKAPVSLTLLALERREGLRDSIIAVPEVRAAIDQGHVRVVAQTPPAAAPPSRRAARAEKEE